MVFLGERWTLNGWAESVVPVGNALFVGGGIRGYRPIPAPGIISVDPVSGNPDGVLPVGTGFTGNPACVVETADAIYVGGFLWTYRGVPAHHLVRLNKPDLSLDATFNAGAGFDGWVRSLVVAGGKLWVGGSFTRYRGVNHANLVLLDLVTGDVDTSFASQFEPNGEVRTLVTDGTSVWAGGAFDDVGVNPSKGLVRFAADGSMLATGFVVGNGFDNQVLSLALDGTHLYAGGAFTTYKEQPAQRLVRLDAATGTLDAGFQSTTGPDATVWALLPSNGDLYVGGDFSAYRGTSVTGLARVNATTGALDETFQHGLPGLAYALALAGGALIVGGGFNESGMQGIAALDTSTGALLPTFSTHPGLSFAGAGALHVSGGSLWMLGGFLGYRGIATGNLIKIDLATGDLDATFGVGSGPDGSVSTLVPMADGLLVGGGFNRYRGACISSCSYAGLFKVDLATGALDTAFTQSGNFNNRVETIAVNDGAVYVGGQFATYRGTSVPKLVKLDGTNGDLVPGFSSGGSFDDYPLSLAAGPDGLLVAGHFTTYRGAPALGAAKLAYSDGAPDATFTGAMGTDTNGARLIRVSGDSVYLGGAFNRYLGSPVDGLVRLDLLTGQQDTVFTALSGLTGGRRRAVQDILEIGTRIVLAEGADSSNGIWTYRLTELDPVDGHVLQVMLDNDQLDSSIDSMVMVGPRLWVGGTFGTIHGANRRGLAPLDPATGALMLP